MASGRNTIRRWITILFDRPSAKKAEGELAASMGAAGKKGGENFLREARAAFERRLSDLKNLLAKGLINQSDFKRQADIAARTFNTSIISGMEKARAAGTLTDKEYLKLSKTLKTVGDTGAGAGARLGAAFLKAGVAIGAFIGFRRLLTDSVQAALQAESSVSRLDAVLQPLGLSYRKVSGEVEKYLNNLQKTTRFGDEDAREALVNLVTITGDYNLSLRLLDVTAKIAEKRHTTMAAAAQTAADASKGLTKGMKDLGINAKDTGDIVEKINKNLGDLAVEGGKTSSGQLAILNNLLGEVKESFGDAILKSDGFTGSVGDLRTALIDLNTWIKGEGGTTIRSFISLLVIGAQGIGKALASGGTIQGSINRRILDERKKAEEARLAPDKAGAERVAEQIAFTERLLTEVTTEGTKKRVEISEEEKERRKKRAKELGAELERTEREIAVKILMIQKGLTEDLAREAIRRQELLRPLPERTGVTPAQIEEAWKRLAAANEMLDMSTRRTSREFDYLANAANFAVDSFIKGKAQADILKAALVELGLTLAQVGDAAFGAAEKFSTPWVDALDSIRNEVEGQGTLFRELGQAWAEGGLKGIAALAAQKVKENIAQVIEWGAKAIGMFVLGNPVGAAGAAKTAALHAAAAVAWKAIAGGGGGSSSASSTGGVGSRAPNLARSESMEKPGAEVSIYLTGPGFNALNPEVQKIVYGAQQNARERFGANAKIRIIRRDH